MYGHTTQLGPHEDRMKGDDFDPRKYPLIEFKEIREHILILLVLLFFSVNIAFVFINNSSSSTIVDTIKAPDFLAAVGEFFSF